MARAYFFGFNAYDTLFAAILRAARMVEKDRTGGFFGIFDTATGDTLLLSICGEVRLEKIAKYGRFAPEKARRLATFPDHIASSQSRNPAEEKYSGAIRGTHFIFSFSGFSEAMDEAIILLYALLTGQITRGRVSEIITLSNNESWQKLHQVFDDGSASAI